MLNLFQTDLKQIQRQWLRVPFVVIILIAIILSFLWLKSSAIITVIVIGLFLLSSLQTLFNTPIAGSGSGQFKPWQLVISRYATILAMILITTLTVFLFTSLFNLAIHSFDLGRAVPNAATLIYLGVATIYMLFLTPFMYAFNQRGFVFGGIPFLVFTITLIYLLPRQLLVASKFPIWITGILTALIISIVASIIIVQHRKGVRSL